jgi:hypothetical protein
MIHLAHCYQGLSQNIAGLGRERESTRKMLQERYKYFSLNKQEVIAEAHRWKYYEAKEKVQYQDHIN